MTTYYAIRNTEAKGVYTDKQLFDEKVKQHKGCSHRVFDSEQEAIKWAGVNGIGNAKQQVIKRNSFEAVFEHYKKEKKNTLNVYLIDGSIRTITLQPHYYVNKQFQKKDYHYHSRTGELETNTIDRLYTKLFKLEPSSMEIVNEDYILFKNIDKDSLGAQEFREMHGSYRTFHHAIEEEVIQTQHIISIKPMGVWILNDQRVTDQAVFDYLVQREQKQ